MNRLVSLVEQNPAVAQAAFDRVEAALNQVLPGNDVHARYEDAEAIGLAIVIGRTTHRSYNPFDASREEPSFSTDNQADRSDAWDAMPIPPEFLDQPTTLGRFAFFALAKAENLRITGRLSSYDSRRLAISPGRVGFAGGRRLMESFLALSGLWEVHDHLVSGAYSTEVAEVATEAREPRTADDFAEYFEREFARIQALHEGVRAADLSHADVGKLLPLVDSLPYDS